MNKHSFAQRATIACMLALLLHTGMLVGGVSHVAYAESVQESTPAGRPGFITFSETRASSDPLEYWVLLDAKSGERLAKYQQFQTTILPEGEYIIRSRFSGKPEQHRARVKIQAGKTTSVSLK